MVEFFALLAEWLVRTLRGFGAFLAELLPQLFIVAVCLSPFAIAAYASYVIGGTWPFIIVIVGSVLMTEVLQSKPDGV